MGCAAPRAAACCPHLEEPGVQLPVGWRDEGGELHPKHGTRGVAQPGVGFGVSVAAVRSGRAWPATLRCAPPDRPQTAGVLRVLRPWDDAPHPQPPPPSTHMSAISRVAKVTRPLWSTTNSRRASHTSWMGGGAARARGVGALAGQGHGCAARGGYAARVGPARWRVEAGPRVAPLGVRPQQTRQTGVRSSPHSTGATPQHGPGRGPRSPARPPPR